MYKLKKMILNRTLTIGYDIEYKWEKISHYAHIKYYKTNVN